MSDLSPQAVQRIIEELKDGDVELNDCECRYHTAVRDAAATLAALAARVETLEQERRKMHRRAQEAEALNLHARSALHALRHIGKACLAEVSAPDRDALYKADAACRARAEAAEALVRALEQQVQEASLIVNTALHERVFDSHSHVVTSDLRRLSELLAQPPDALASPREEP